MPASATWTSGRFVDANGNMVAGQKGKSQPQRKSEGETMPSGNSLADELRKLKTLTERGLLTSESPAT
jgi:hypothetical protein